MKINNISDVDKKIECNQFTTNYLIKQGFYPISKENKTYYFAKNDNILEKLNNAPFHIRVFGKGGDR